MYQYSRTDQQQVDQRVIQFRDQTDRSRPVIINPDQLFQSVSEPDILLVDLRCKREYDSGHLPNAVRLDYNCLVEMRPPVLGLLPCEEKLSALFSWLGLSRQTHVIAYDQDAGAAACRLLWTLDVIGHRGFSLLNGGYSAWVATGLPTERRCHQPEPTTCNARIGNHGIRSKDQILEKLNDPNVVLLDSRSALEFTGEEPLAARGGHIPGAVNLDWIETTDPARHYQLLDQHTLRMKYQSLGIVPEKEIIAYCQTHRRSSHTCIVLKSLGYENVHAYPGSWSQWGNCEEVPIESDDSTGS